MPDKKRIVRQLNIISDLAARRFGVTYRELAALYEVHTRTIQRDLKFLSEEADFEFHEEVRDRRKYFKLVKSNLPPLNFSIDEIIALTFIEGIVSPLEDEPYKEEFQKILNRIRAVVPDQRREFLEKASEAYYPHHRGQKAQPSPEIFKTAHHAINERKVCTVIYRVITTGQTKTYPIIPLRFLYYHNGYYLLCRHPNHDNLLTLAAERIRRLKVTSQTFDPPDAEDIENRIQQVFGITLEAPMDVKVRFSASQAPYIKQRTWHPTQEIEEVDDGEIILSFRASGLYEIKSWILSHGKDAEVLEPPDLRDAIIEELQKNLGLY